MDTTQQQQEDIRTRQKLATTIVSAGLIVVGVLCVSLIVVSAFSGRPEAQKDATQLVLSSVLPLVGTWIGTVLAFYFAKENFEAASRATKEILGIDEKLKSTPVTRAMISADKIDAFKLGSKVTLANESVIEVPKSPDDISVDQALDFLAAKNRSRLPVFDATGRCVYVAHASVMDKYCSDELRKSAGLPTPQNPPASAASSGMASGQTPPATPVPASGTSATPFPRTLKDLRRKSPKLFDTILAWACVPEAASLADAKHAMETTPNCQDVMVTKTGKADSPVVGWLTNIEIAQNSKA